MAATAQQPDYYKLLGVGYSATGEEITRAYRLAMKETHPDRHAPERRSHAEERTKLLNVAYSTLSQPERRRQYDSTLRANSVQEQIMNRYSGMTVPGEHGTPTYRQPPPRYRSPYEAQERKRADRSATTSLLYIFGGAALFVVLTVIMFGIVVLVWNRVF